MQKVIIIGNLGRDPEMRYTPSGVTVVNFTVASTYKRKVDGGTKDETTWFQVTAFGKLGEICHQYLAKGIKAYIEGRLTIDEYTDRDGAKQKVIKVIASEVQFLSAKRETQDSPEPPAEDTHDLPF